MKEEINEIFFDEKINDDEMKKTYNQSIEILQTEDIFINQKEEIKRIKKKRMEVKNFNQNKTKFINLKYIKNKRAKFNTLNNLNLTEVKKTTKNINKSNLNNINKNLDKKEKKFILKDQNIKTLKLKFFPDNNPNNENKEKIKSENEINKKNDIESNNNTNNNEEENTIINNDNEIMLSTEKEIDYISLLNLDNFQKCDCILNENYFNNYCYDDINTYDEIPKITKKWTNLNNTSKIDLNSKGKIYIPNIKINNNFDFSKTVLITKNIIDYNNKGVQININLKLYEKSTFWIFTRCYVGNYDYLTEEIKKNKTITLRQKKLNLIDPGDNDNEDKKIKMFSKYSTVIKIFKNKNSNKAFVSFGTFYKNKASGNLHYKSFLQRQLVNFVHEDNNYYYLENDLCEFDIIIIDSGNEYIQAKISLNNKEKYNNIKSNFYLPLNKKAKIMFCGEGNNIKVTKLEIKSFVKYDEGRDKFGILLSDERKECDCCSII